MSVPYIRLSGDEEGASNYVRPGKQLLHRAREMKKLTKQPVIQLFDDPDPHTVIFVRISGELETIYIHHEKGGVLSEEKKEELEREDYFCPPAFVVYDRKLGPSIDQYNAVPHIVAYDSKGGRWREATVPNFATSVSGGWYHLKEVHKELADPGAHQWCDLVTWYGNPNSFGDDRIWTDGGFGRDNTLLLRKGFFYQGQWIPAPEPVLGACLLPKKGVDYWYVLTCDVTYDNPNYSKDGVDDKVWRRPYSGGSWEEVATVPYLDYADSALNFFIPYGTAYIDAEGVAWYTKLVWKAAGADRVLIKLDLRTGIHSQEKSAFDTAPTSSRQEYKSHDGNFYTDLKYRSEEWPNNGSFQNSFGAAEGEQYIMTMGGTRARYDLYVSMVYSDSYDYSAVGPITYRGKDQADDDLYTKDFTIDKTAASSVKAELVIKKDDVEIWRGPLAEVDVTYASSTQTTWTGQVFPDQSTIYSWDQDDQRTNRQFNYKTWLYLFLHPDALAETIVVDREHSRYGGLHYNGVDTGLTKIKRGTEILASASGSVSPAASGTAGGGSGAFHWSDSFVEEAGNEPARLYVIETEAITHTVDDNETGYRFCYGLRPNTLTFSMFEGAKAGPTSFLNYPLARSIYCSIGFTPGLSAGWDGEGVHHGHRARASGAMMHESWGRPHHPGTVGIHRPIKKGVPWSYLIAQPFFYETGYGTDKVYHTDPVESLIGAASDEKDVLDYDNGRPFYTICLTGNAWTASPDPDLYKERELVYYKKSLYRCIADHNPTLSTEPTVGAFWELYWELYDYKFEVRSNVLTGKQIKKITREEDERILDIGVL